MGVLMTELRHLVAIIAGLVAIAVGLGCSAFGGGRSGQAYELFS
jgi:hypothetical protein